MAQSPPPLISSRLAAAMSHPTRFHTMAALGQLGSATPAEIAAKIGEPLNNVTYHIKVLLELGCIELVGAEPARGGRVMRHVYRTTRRAYLETEAWEQLSEKEKLVVSNGLMRQISEDVAEAMADGSFYEADDSHVSRMPMDLDRKGWDEVVVLLKATLDRLIEIQEEMDARASEDSEATPSKVAIIHFRSPR